MSRTKRAPSAETIRTSCSSTRSKRRATPGTSSFRARAASRPTRKWSTGLKAGYEKISEHGWLPWLSCNPWANTRIPKMGEYCASSESSAAAYINTILGARTNRESPINTVYCAYTGCLPKYGSHLDENRAAKCIVELDDETRDNMVGAADWAALGACIAEKAENRIMAVLNLPKKMGPTASKQIISCCSPGMNDPILHLMGYTPESPTLEDAFKGKMPKNPERFTVTMDDIVEMYRHINNIAPAPGPERAKPVDIVIFGCPHATFEEVREVARLLKGRKVKPGVMLWVQTDTPSYHMAHQYGDAKIIEEAGGKIYHQTCMAMNPVRHYPQGITIATDSFKYVKLGGGFGMAWIFANPPALVEGGGYRRVHADRALGLLGPATEGAAGKRKGAPALQPALRGLSNRRSVRSVLDSSVDDRVHPIERPEEVNAMVLRFLKELGS